MARGDIAAETAITLADVPWITSIRSNRADFLGVTRAMLAIQADGMYLIEIGQGAVMRGEITEGMDGLTSPSME